MSEKLLRCDGTDTTHQPDWDSVVGLRTLENGGMVGDLLKVVRAHIEEAKNNGEITENGAGEAYATGIMEAMKNAITFELGYPKASLELCLLQAQIDKLKCDCDNDTNMTDSKISLNAAQENKLACDCCNSSIVSASQGRLYDRQAKGFDDNANQKLYDSQLSAWSMVFADTDLAEVTDSINEENVNRTYKRLANRLATGAGMPCSLNRKSVSSSGAVSCKEEPCDSMYIDC
ncbi:MAG: hypothetical protein KAH01_07255 [Caldisericia bacterium]|nr:hypothetical protein [Caldisericia bacterium]